MVLPLIKPYKLAFAKIYLLISLGAMLWHIYVPNELLDTVEYRELFPFVLGEIDQYQSVEGHWMGFARRTPLYPAILFATNKYVLQIIQWIITLLIPVLIFNGFHIERSSRQEQNAFWLISLSMPLQFFFCGFNMPEIWAELGVAIWLFGVYRKKLHLIGWSSVLLVLLKPIFIFLIPLNALLSLWLGGTALSRAGLSSWVKPLIAILFLLSWNKSLGYKGISSVGTNNLYGYNRYMLLSAAKGSSFTDSVYRTEADLLNKLSNRTEEKGEIMRTKFRQSLMNYPLKYAYIHIKGILRMFIDPGRYDAMVFLDWPVTSGFLGVKSNHKEGALPWYQWSFIVFFTLLNVSKFLAMGMGFFTLRFKKMWVIGLSLFIFSYSILIGPVGTARYLVPLYPMIWILVFCGVKRWLK